MKTLVLFFILFISSFALAQGSYDFRKISELYESLSNSLNTQNNLTPAQEAHIANQMEVLMDIWTQNKSQDEINFERRVFDGFPLDFKNIHSEALKEALGDRVITIYSPTSHPLEFKQNFQFLLDRVVYANRSEKKFYAKVLELFLEDLDRSKDSMYSGNLKALAAYPENIEIAHGLLRQIFTQSKYAGSWAVTPVGVHDSHNDYDSYILISIYEKLSSIFNTKAFSDVLRAGLRNPDPTIRLISLSLSPSPNDKRIAQQILSNLYSRDPLLVSFALDSLSHEHFISSEVQNQLWVIAQSGNENSIKALDLLPEHKFPKGQLIRRYLSLPPTDPLFSKVYEEYGADFQNPKIRKMAFASLKKHSGDYASLRILLKGSLSPQERELVIPIVLTGDRDYSKSDDIKLMTGPISDQQRPEVARTYLNAQDENSRLLGVELLDLKSMTVSDAALLLNGYKNSSGGIFRSFVAKKFGDLRYHGDKVSPEVWSYLDERLTSMIKSSSDVSYRADLESLYESALSEF